MSTACQQLEVFSRVLRTSLATILDGGEENLEKNLPEFAVSALSRIRRGLGGGRLQTGDTPCLQRVRWSQGSFRDRSSVWGRCSRLIVFSALSLCHPEPLTPPALFQKMVCHGEHTYLFAQAMMSVLAQEEQGGSAVRRIAQEVQRFAQEK